MAVLFIDTGKPDEFRSTNEIKKKSFYGIIEVVCSKYRLCLMIRSDCFQESIAFVSRTFFDSEMFFFGKRLYVSAANDI